MFFITNKVLPMQHEYNDQMIPMTWQQGGERTACKRGISKRGIEIELLEENSNKSISEISIVKKLLSRVWIDCQTFYSHRSSQGKWNYNDRYLARSNYHPSLPL